MELLLSELYSDENKRKEKKKIKNPSYAER